MIKTAFLLVGMSIDIIWLSYNHRDHDWCWRSAVLFTVLSAEVGWQWKDGWI